MEKAEVVGLPHNWTLKGESTLLVSKRADGKFESLSREKMRKSNGRVAWAYVMRMGLKDGLATEGADLMFGANEKDAVAKFFARVESL